MPGRGSGGRPRSAPRRPCDFRMRTLFRHAWTRIRHNLYTESPVRVLPPLGADVAPAVHARWSRLGSRPCSGAVPGVLNALLPHRAPGACVQRLRVWFVLGSDDERVVRPPHHTTARGVRLPLGAANVAHGFPAGDRSRGEDNVSGVDHFPVPATAPPASRTSHFLSIRTANRARPFAQTRRGRPR